ncbi:MAG TPA: hypothetical protein VM597_29060 [Gemmataceae bacterium]|jgi:hypothetical protein|nr:hypothetical protein [Gemmataceae bacterium]
MDDEYLDYADDTRPVVPENLAIARDSVVGLLVGVGLLAATLTFAFLVPRL